MIACPFCQTSLAETAPSCPRCNLDLQKVRGILGPVPRLSPTGISDLTRTLSPSDEKTLRKASLAFNERFPQCRILILIKNFAPQFPLGVHLFWIFNTAGLSGDDHKHGRNRDILIGLDPGQNLAGMMVGYGLEPFLPQTALERVMELSSMHFKNGNFTTGLKVIIEQLAELMEGICRDLPSILGLREELVVTPSPIKEY